MITILRSKQNTQYHRILFVMSFMDAITSLCTALTTLPMPSNVNQYYKFEGPSFGNYNTCEAQGFLILVGMGYAIASNIFLNIYYLCKIRYHVSDEKFRKWAEPMFLILSTIASTVAPSFFLSKDLINPTPLEPYCAMAVYPAQCTGLIVPNGSDTEFSGIECLRASVSEYVEVDQRFHMMTIIILGIEFMMLIISMSLIICTVRNSKNTIDVQIRDRNRTESTSDGEEQRIKENSRKTPITVQVLMYTIACLLSWIFLVLKLTYGDVNSDKTIILLKAIFTPLQGFFNLLIFIFHKNEIVSETKTKNGYFQTLKLMVTSPNEIIEKYEISNMVFFQAYQDQIPKEIDDDIKCIALGESERKEEKDILDAEQNDNGEKDLVKEDSFLSSSFGDPFSDWIGMGSQSTTSEPTNQYIFKRISEYKNRINPNISNQEDMFSVESPDSVRLGSSKNDEEALSYMSKSYDIASEGAVSHSASTVKR
ncbi:hypothetical protein CTEN210_08993 [Chaetoceros tenuissimus]|uniref:G-protein coupled receptors family 1 profile domain-containing protein n=1 Tax=Chaetoceros tenuissimus TaxID=426638 RepID=A0AAD3H6K9_9STRA|nr:hypothetical protein CTEN210_08993 [Chaetoceros tenuissimus]